MSRARVGRRWAILGALVFVISSGCGHAAAPKPPVRPPSPASITREEPGGDSSDPHAAALGRLTKEPWGWRNDKDDVLRIPLPDAQNWRRVKYIGVPSFVGYRYGDAHHAVIAVWVRPADERTATPEACLASFEEWGGPIARSFSVTLDPGAITRVPWTDREIAIRSVYAEINTLFAKKNYEAAYGAYVMWPGTCTILGVAVPTRGATELAAAVRDRFLKEGFLRMERRAATAPAAE